MNLLILVALLLLSIPSLSAAQTFPGGSAQHDKFGSITAVPLAPNVTEYQGSDGTNTTVIQTTPYTQSYFSRDKHGHEQNGVIVSPFANPSTRSRTGTGDVLRSMGDHETADLLDTLQRMR